MTTFNSNFKARFADKVRTVVRTIPAGQTRSYKEVAHAAG